MIDINNKIISGCKNGNHRAQMEFYRLYYKAVYNCCYRILLHTDEAEDAMQESFIKAFGKLETLGDSPVEAWLRRIAVNTSIDRLKKRRVITVELSEQLPVPDDESYDEELIAYKVNTVKAAIARLPDACRLILNLHLFEGYDYDEISEILNMKPGTVRVSFVRARNKLVELLKQEEIFKS